MNTENSSQSSASVHSGAGPGPASVRGRRGVPAWVVSFLLAVAFLGFFVFVARGIIAAKPEAKPVKRAEPVFSVRAVAARPADRAPSVFLIGETEARNYAALTSPLGTEALAAPVREGDAVSRGDRLAILDLRDQKLDLQDRELRQQLQAADLEDIQVQSSALSVNLRTDLEDIQLQLQSLAETRQTNLDDVRVQLESLAADRQSDRKRLADINRLLTLAEDELARARGLSESGVVPKTQVEENERAVLNRRLERQAAEARVEKYDSDERLLRIRERQLNENFHSETKRLRVRRRELNENFDSETKRLRVRETQARAQAEQTRVDLERARIAYERAHIRAPFSGKVARVHVSAGSRVAPGAQLVEIFDPASVRLRAAVPNQYLPALRSGNDARARLRTDGETLTLSAFRIAPLTEPGRGASDVYFELPPREWVLGATREFEMELPPVAGAIAVPFDALYSDTRIYRIDGESRARGLDCERAGVSRDDDGESRALMRCPGLQPGEMIVATRLPNLADGSKVEVVDEINSGDGSGFGSESGSGSESDSKTESGSDSDSGFDSGSDSGSDSDS